MKNKILGIVGLGCALLLHCVFASYSHARIIGFEDFDGGGYGWNWDNSVAGAPVQDGVSAGWTNRSAPDNITIGDYVTNGAVSVTSTVIRRPYHSGTLNAGSDAAPTGERLGALRSTYLERGIVQFDLAVTGNMATHVGMSFYDFNAEIVFFGMKSTGNFGINGTEVILGDTIKAVEGQNYKVVGLWDYNPQQMYMWVFDADYQPQYTDLFSPYAQRTNTSGSWNSNVGLNVGNGSTGTFDNITVATEFTDIFGAPPEVKQIRESFSGYESGAIAGQLYRNLGQRAPGVWAVHNPATSATVDNSKNLVYNKATGAYDRDPEGLWANDAGLLVVNSTSAKMDLDMNVFDQWGLLGTDNKVGGAGVDGDFYYGFLVQYTGEGQRTSGYSAVQFNNGADEVLGITASNTAWAYSGFGKTGNFNLNSENRETTATYEHIDDKETHLVIAKISYNSTGDDTLTVWFDPDLTKAMQTQNATLITTPNNADLAFDNVIFRSGSTFNYDELRMGTTWNNLTGYSDNAPTRMVEDFSGYARGPALGQNYLRPGEAVGRQWSTRTGTTITGSFEPLQNLAYKGWTGSDGLLVNTPNGTTNVETVMNLDLRMIDEWGLLGANGMVGGGDVFGELYYGFLVQYTDETVTPTGWSGGAQLFRGTADSGEILGLSRLGNNPSFSGFIRGNSTNNADIIFRSPADGGAPIPIDDEIHLILAKIVYNENGLDDLTVWFDPDMDILGDTSSIVYQKDEVADLSFDTIIFRNGGNEWLYDEFRMASSWGALADGSPDGAVPEPATWVMLLLGAGAVLAMRRKRG